MVDVSLLVFPINLMYISSGVLMVHVLFLKGTVQHVFLNSKLQIKKLLRKPKAWRSQVIHTDPVQLDFNDSDITNPPLGTFQSQSSCDFHGRRLPTGILASRQCCSTTNPSLVTHFASRRSFRSTFRRYI